MCRVSEARKGRRVVVAAGIAWVCLVLGSSLSGGAAVTSVQLVDPTGGEDRYYGWSVAVSGDGTAALVGGAGEECAAGAGCGKAFVFSRQGGIWTSTAELTLAAGAEFDLFGYGVALSADATTALIGAPGRDCPAGSCGAAYVFERQGGAWVQSADLTAVDPRDGASFGTAVVLSADGGTALIMAPSEHETASFEGALYIFTRSGSSWSQTGRLAIAGPGTSSGWRATLSQDGSTILSSVRDTACPAGHSCGAGYVYVRSGGSWVQQARLAVPSPDPPQISDPDAPTGRPVALSADGNTAVLGVMGDFCANGTCGAASVFQRNGASWSEPQKITVAGTREGDLFGTTLSLSGDGNTLLVGAQGTDLNLNGGEPDHGALYVFTRAPEGFLLRQSLLSPEGRNSLFPAHIALSQDGTTAVAGVRHAKNPTAYALAITGSVQDIPTLSGIGLAALAVLLAAGGALALRRRSAA